jgi:ATP-binding cassette subfamily B (MDR/TAP) protein 1
MAAPQERAAANAATLDIENSPGKRMDEKLDAPSEEGATKTLTSGLSDHDKQIIDRQTEAPKLSVGYFALFRYANKKHAFIMIISLIASIAAGAVMPLMTVCALRYYVSEMIVSFSVRD